MNAKDNSLRFDTVCSRFDREWTESSTPPELESYLFELDDDQRRELLKQLLPIDVKHRRQRSMECDASCYLARFPQFADTINAIVSSSIEMPDTFRSGSLATNADDDSIDPLDSTITITGYTSSKSSNIPEDLQDQSRYKIIRHLGTGGMGTVYLAEHLISGRRVALKIVRCDRAESDSLRERLRREIRAVSRLDHPNVIRVFDAEMFNRTLCMSMEYVVGSSLSELVRQNGGFDVRTACKLVAQVATGLDHAHRQGVIHRDIKPGNLLVSDEALNVKIGDFGLAKILDDTTPGNFVGTPAGFAMGTIGYMAPEQATDARTAGVHADIYSLGRTFYYLLTGVVPAASVSNDPVTRTRIASGEQDVAPISKFRDDVPRGLIRVIESMTARDIAGRFSNACEVVDALSSWAKSDTKSERKWWRSWMLR